MPARGRTVGVETLHVGMRLSLDIYDPDGILLLAAGSQINSRFLYQLRQRDIGFVRLEPGEPEPPTSLTDSATSSPSDMNAGTGASARLPLEDLYTEARRGLEAHLQAGEVLAELGDSLGRGGNASADKMSKLVDGFVDQITIDQDLLMTIMSLKQTEGEYLFDHSINVSLLSMAMGAELGLPKHKLQELGLGAVFQDIGMLKIPESIRLSPNKLTDREWEIIKTHPAHTLKCLEGMRGLPSVAPHIAYQVHERADGSGYPRGRSVTTTHPYARVVGIADVFCAMTRPRPYRSPIMPHKSVKQILKSARDKKSDRAMVRAFLDRASAFPIGSVVEISDGRHVRVIRATAREHTRPVVVEVDEADQPVGESIDLSKQRDLSVVREISYIFGNTEKLNGR